MYGGQVMRRVIGRSSWKYPYLQFWRGRIKIVNVGA